MKRIGNSYQHALWIAIGSIVSLALNGNAMAQTGSTTLGPEQSRIAAAVSNLRARAYFPADLTDIARGQAREAIPDLESEFGTTPDQVLKVGIASALVRLRDPIPMYWTYLESQAREAIESDLPYPAAFGQDGELIPGVSREFTAWVESHKTTVDEAGRKAALEFPARVAYLGISGDARAIPLLRLALRSQNYLIQVQASEGLVELNDKSSIQAIVDACRAAPGKAAMPIAAPLGRFDDVVAQQAAKHFNPPVPEQRVVNPQPRN